MPALGQTRASRSRTGSDSTKVWLNSILTSNQFAIGSITKQFTCACIFLLAEEGKLSVKDPVAKYFPDLTRANDITLYDLMTHVSGYPDYYPLDFVDREMAKTATADAIIQEYAARPLDFASVLFVASGPSWRR